VGRKGIWWVVEQFSVFGGETGGTNRELLSQQQQLTPEIEEPRDARHRQDPQPIRSKGLSQRSHWSRQSGSVVLVFSSSSQLHKPPGYVRYNQGRFSEVS